MRITQSEPEGEVAVVRLENGIIAVVNNSPHTVSVGGDLLGGSKDFILRPGERILHQPVSATLSTEQEAQLLLDALRPDFKRSG